MFDEYPDVLNVEGLCTALHIGKNTAYKLLKNGEIKSCRIGNVHKIPKIYVIDYLMTKSAQLQKDVEDNGQLLYNGDNYNNGLFVGERSNFDYDR